MPRIRADRLLTNCLFHPLQRMLGGNDQGGAVILMYHSVSDAAEDGVPEYYRVATRPKVFAEQMDMLQADGCQVTGVGQGMEILRRGAARKLVMVTFDDGFRDFYTEAFPVLQKRGFSATMYLPTAFIGADRRKFKERECMTWDEVRECRRAGIEFGSHTVNHPRLYELDFTQIRAELKESRATLEQELGERIAAFAYPYAFPSADRGFVEAFNESLKEAGYESNVTTRIGRVRAGDDPFTLKRLPVNSADDAALFRAKLRGAYDWMNWPQDVFKKLKSVVVVGRGAGQPGLAH